MKVGCSHIAKKLFMLGSFTFLTHCGTNAFTSLEPVNPAVDSVKQLEAGDPKKAEEILLTALGTSFSAIYKDTTIDNLSEQQTKLADSLNSIIESASVSKPANLVSLLASARANIHEIDELQIALKLAASESTEEESSETSSETTTQDQNEITLLFPALPEPTSVNIEGAEIAVGLLRSLGSHATEIDEYKLAMYQVASLSLSMKTLDVDKDGSISTAESINITEDSAKAILSQLLAASSAASGSESVEEGSASAETATAIGGIYSEIENSPGSTDSERLSNFLSGGE